MKSINEGFSRWKILSGNFMSYLHMYKIKKNLVHSKFQREREREAQGKEETERSKKQEREEMKNKKKNITINN